MGDFALGSIDASRMTAGMAAQQTEQLQRQFATAKKDLEGTTPLTGEALIKKHKELKTAAQKLEGVFFQQLIEAMDKTVDREDSLMGGGEAEDMFREMMNQNVAENMATAPGGSGLGLAESIYHQLSSQLPALPKDVQIKEAHRAYRQAGAALGDKHNQQPTIAESGPTMPANSEVTP